MNKLTCIIIDDEAHEREKLSALLAQSAFTVEVLAVCNSVAEGVRAIQQFSPQIVFCDIEMPVISGLQLLDFFDSEQVRFELIFATAHSSYAVRAFQLSATDYLLKPIEKTYLEKALEKVVRHQNFKQQERYEMLKNSLQQQQFTRIALPSAGGVDFVEIGKMVVLRADNVYTHITTQDGKTLMVSKPIKEFEKLLPQEQFFRCHRSYIVNLNAVKTYNRSEGGSLVLSNETEIPLARDRRDDFQLLWKHQKV
ncbi:MAG: LytTR family DNA-binding domain-containing protein [Chitinophagales bacterium]